MKLHALIATCAFAAVCSTAPASQNNNAVSPLAGFDSIQAAVATPGTAPIAKNVSEIRPALVTRPTLGAIGNSCQETVTISTAGKMPAWNVIQHQSSVVFNSQIIVAKAWQRDLGLTAVGSASPPNAAPWHALHRTSLVESTFSGAVAWAQPHSAGWNPDTNDPAAGEYLGQHWAETQRVHA